MAVGSSFLQVGELVEALFGTFFVAQDLSGDHEFTVTGQWGEVHGAEAIGLQWGKRHSKDTFLTPLEVQAGNVEVSAQRIWEEEAMLKPPGLGFNIWELLEMTSY